MNQNNHEYINPEDMKSLHNLKDAYQHIPVPEAARERIQQGIDEANRIKTPSNLMVFVKAAGITAAAAMVAITILANTNASVAHAMAKIPVIGSISKVVTFRDYRDEVKNFNASIKVPKVESDTKSDASSNENLANTNKTIEEYADQLIAQYEADLKASNGEGHYSLESDYEVIRENDDYLALRINTLLTMAGGTQYTKVFNIDKNTGNLLSLSDFFQEDSDYIHKISENIKEQMESQMKEDDSVTYFYHSDVPEWNFDEIREDASFYFNDKDELVICFDEYEVAPGYMGAVSFTIPHSVTDGLLK